MDDDMHGRGAVERAAESTRFRSSPVPESADPSMTGMDGLRTSESYLASAKSIRMGPRNARGSLAVRVAVPIITGMLIGFLVISLILRDRVAKLQLNDIKVHAANGAFVTGLFGRLLITHREDFLEANPEYRQMAEWKAGEHWLVTHGFVGPRDWVAATGFELDEYAPAAVMEKAGEKAILADLKQYINFPRADTELIAVFILNADGTVLAASQKEGFRFDPLALKAVPLPVEHIEAGGSRVYIDYIAAIEPEPLVRGLVRIMSRTEPDTIIGTALVVMRTQRHSREQNAFLYLLTGLALALTVLMSLVCWYAVRRVTAPMRRMAADMQAIVEGDYARRAPTPGSDEMGQLAQAFNSMAERLRVARINERETSRLESDLSIARDIQNNLLPPQTPRVRGLDMHTSYRPAKEIGGDYFDFLPVDDRHMGVVVADASGKSIPAALVMSNTRAILRFVAPGGLSAAETLSRVNSILSVDIPKGMFVTAYYTILDPLAGQMLCASAGHTPLLIARADDSVEILNPGGIALGFDGGPIFQRSIREQRVKLESGDRVLLYTDGVVECVNTANEEYSDRRLREFLRRNRTLSSHDFVGALMADLDRFRGAAEMRDDTTIVTFRVL